MQAQTEIEQLRAELEAVRRMPAARRFSRCACQKPPVTKIAGTFADNLQEHRRARKLEEEDAARKQKLRDAGLARAPNFTAATGDGRLPCVLLATKI